MAVTKETIIADLLTIDEGITEVLLSAGMHCLGCMMASGESIEEACYVHGINPDDMVQAINDFIDSKKAE